MLSYTIKNLDLGFALIFFAKTIILLRKKTAINAVFGY
jgi:hypothetical protein